MRVFEQEHSVVAPVTITDRSGTRTVTADQFREERGLRQCQVCFTWDTPDRFARRRHSCRWISTWSPNRAPSGVDARISTRAPSARHVPVDDDNHSVDD